MMRKYSFIRYTGKPFVIYANKFFYLFSIINRDIAATLISVFLLLFCNKGVIFASDRETQSYKKTIGTQAETVKEESALRRKRADRVFLLCAAPKNLSEEKPL